MKKRLMAVIFSLCFLLVFILFVTTVNEVSHTITQLSETKNIVQDDNTYFSDAGEEDKDEDDVCFN